MFISLIKCQEGGMIQNKIYHITAMEADKIVQETNESANLHLVELQGEEIQSWEDYMSKIESAFEFPTSCIDNVNRYNNWLRDLSWLGKDGYVLIIRDFKDFLNQDLILKYKTIGRYADTVLPWWGENIEKYIIDGKAKPFNVYLVD